MRTRRLVAFLILTWPLTAAAMQAPVGPAEPERSAGNVDAAIRSTYVLGTDDQLVIQVVDVPDINGKTQRIDPAGDLRLPMVGRVHAAGMTVEQLEAELTRRLKVYLHEPDVSVSVAEFHSQPVSVIGAVNTAGVHQLSGHKTLVEILSMAGGASADAGPNVRVTRRAEWGRIPLPEAMPDATGAYSTVDIDLKSLLNAVAPEKNIVIRPNDVISVPRAELVYVVGEVGKAGPVPISGGQSVSVLEAVSSSGGVLRSASPKHARILRKETRGDTRTEIAVDLSKIMQGKDKDIALVSGDILIVPDSRGKRATTRALEAALQAGVMIGTYGIVR